MIGETKRQENLIPENNSFDSMEGVPAEEPVLESEPSEAIEMVIDYDRPIEQAVVAGHYDSIHHQEYFTNENFPVGKDEHGKKEKQCKLFCFKTGATSEEIIRAMAMEGYKPTVLRELLAYGEKCPEAQRSAPIIALGTEWVNSERGERVAAIDCVDDKRRLRQYMVLKKHWDNYSQFLGVAVESDDQGKK